MSRFRRRRALDNEPDESAEPTGADARADPDGADPADDAPAPPVASQGPWDSDDLPAEYADGVIARVDLGGLRVPVRDEVRVDLGPEGEVVAATVILGASAMQLSAFAAPRSEGVWAEVRAEIATALRASGGSADEVPGPFGPELHARIVTPISANTATTVPARFVGIDAPRWFLRALITGPAATDPVQAAAVEQALREVVVVRGWEAMGVKTQVPLRLPREVVEAAAAGQPAPGDDGEARGAGADVRVPAELNPFDRGPEITEVR